MLSPAAEKMLSDLRENTEGGEIEHALGRFKQVYLPNAQGDRSKSEFGGLLAVLKKEGLYFGMGGDFGMVAIPKPKRVETEAESYARAASKARRAKELLATRNARLSRLWLT